MEQRNRLISELLGPGPCGLLKINSGIFFAGGQALFFHFDKDDKECFKYVSSTALRLAFSNSSVDTGWISNGVVRCGINLAGNWYVKEILPGMHEINLINVKKGSHAPVKYRVTLPGLLLIGQGINHYCFAYKGKECSPGSLLHQAPLPNVYPNGRICWGSNEAPQVDQSKSDAIWKLFIGSPFNCDLANGKSRQHPLNIMERLENQIEDEPYPEDDLEAAIIGNVYQLTLETYLNKVILNKEIPADELN